MEVNSKIKERHYLNNKVCKDEQDDNPYNLLVVHVQHSKYNLFGHCSTVTKKWKKNEKTQSDIIQWKLGQNENETNSIKVMVPNEKEPSPGLF